MQSFEKSIRTLSKLVCASLDAKFGCGHETGEKNRLEVMDHLNFSRAIAPTPTPFKLTEPQ
eukprot:3484166-Amphidinium_carterae.1